MIKSFTLVAIIVVVAVALAVSYYLVIHKPGPSPTTTAPETAATHTTTTTTTTTFTTTTVTTATTQWAPDGTISPGEYVSSASFGGGVFEVYWRIEGNTLYMAIKGRTEGWVAIGFEPSTRMKDADIVFGWVSDNGDVTVVDMYSTGETGPHPPDTELGGTNDILQYGGKEDEGYTIIEFSRHLFTGDQYDKDLSGKGEVNVIWAIGSTDSMTSIHVERGTGTIDLGSE